jgi:serine/threonine-protein kinase
MELLSGRWLAAILKRERRISPDRTSFIACQVLDGLSVAHEAGIVHPDLKPGTIFLAEVAGIRNVLKLLDFGVTKLRAEASAHKPAIEGNLSRTPAFMAPNRLAARRSTRTPASTRSVS